MNADYVPTKPKLLKNGWFETDGGRLADVAADYRVWGLT